MALYEPDGHLVASFPVIPGVDPWKRKQDARDFAKQIGRHVMIDNRQPLVLDAETMSTKSESLAAYVDKATTYEQA